MSPGTDAAKLANAEHAPETNVLQEEPQNSIGFDTVICIIYQTNLSYYQLLCFESVFVYYSYMQIDSYLQDNLQAYSVLFNRCRFGFVSKINMENLKYFSIVNQQKLGKIDIKINIDSIKLLKNNLNFNYLVMTQYQQIIPLLYLLRSQPQNCKILSTKSMIQSAKIYAENFYHIVKKMNQVVTIPTFESEGQIYDNYQLEFKIQFSSWANIYNKQEIFNFIKRCIPLNYGQVFDTEKGINMTAYPSGVNIGSAVWLFENILTKNKCLWVQGMSHHTWRACKQFWIDPIHKQIHNVIFTVGVLSNAQTSVSDEHECIQFLKTITQRLIKGHNSRVVIDDFLVIPDIINYLVYEIREKNKDKFKRLFFTGGSIHSLMSYANSYIQFLTFNHQKRIYEDQPVYPFASYEQLKDRFIAQGTLQQISIQTNIPVKQIIIKSTPYLQFETNFHAYLVQGQNQVTQKMFHKYYNLTKLRKWLNANTIHKITYMCRAEQDMKNIPDLGQPFSLNLIGQNIFLPEQSEWKYYITQGSFPNLMCKYVKKNGWLKLSPIDSKFRQLNKQWASMLSKQLSKLGITIIKCSQNQLSTKSTKIFLHQYKLYIESECEKELNLVNVILKQQQCSKEFKIA